MDIHIQERESEKGTSKFKTTLPHTRKMPKTHTHLKHREEKLLFVKPKTTLTRLHTHTHTMMNIYIYIYIYMCVCVCVCVCV